MFPAPLASSSLTASDSIADLSFLHWLVNEREKACQPALALRGYAVVQDGPAAIMDEIDRWEHRTDGEDVAEAIKRRWDPAGVLVA